ncbi:hypothetical protein RI537_18740 [Aeromonas salmonicida]|uniref:hypothetical protein n=1 Tax=Aeromonas salmonicida TaxID=645 RepID=UPI00343154CC
MSLPPRQFQTVLLGGGLDYATPPIARNPGFATSAINVEPGVTGGYRRSIGYDRFDGRPSPSKNKGYYLFRTDGSLPYPSASGFPVATWSGGSGVLLHSSGGDAFIGALADPSLIAGGTFTIGGQVYTLTDAPSRAARRLDDAVIASAKAADWRRTFIGTVPGIGPVRCVVALLDTIFAIRDQSVTESALFKATASGWQAVGVMGKQFLVRAGYGITDGDVQLVRHSGGAVLDVVAQLSGDGGVGTCTIAAGQSVAFGDVLRSVPLLTQAMTLSAALSSGVTPTADTASNQLGGSTIEPEVAAGWYALVGTTWFPVVSYKLKTGAIHTLILSNPYGKAVPANTSITLYKLSAFAEVQAVSDMTLKAGGKYDTCVFNFFGSPAMRRAYLASGVQRALELREDGRLVPLIANGDDLTDTPTMVEAHADHLFLTYPGGSYLHSGPSNPLSWSGLLGAEQFALGDEITGITTTAGGVLLVTCRNRTVALYGNAPTNWEQKVISESVGVSTGTLQSTFIPVGLSERGLVRLDRVQEFGDFALNLLDPKEKIQPIIERFDWAHSSQLASANQYRLFSTSGRNLAIKINADGEIESTEFSYGAPVGGIWRYNEQGERIFFTLANADGFVYELDSNATSYDGSDINWLLRLAYAHFGAPTIRKQWRGVEFEQSVQGRFVAKLAWSLDYRHNLTSSKVDLDIDTSDGGLWNYSAWNNFYWMSGAAMDSRAVELAGAGSAISLALSGRSGIEPNFSLTGMTIEFVPRRNKRG